MAVHTTHQLPAYRVQPVQLQDWIGDARLARLWQMSWMSSARTKTAMAAPNSTH